MKAVKISKICLEIDGQKIELTLKQAQALKDALNDTFGQKVTQYVYPYYHYLPQPCITWASNTIALNSDTAAYTADMVTSTATAALMGNQLSFSVS